VGKIFRHFVFAVLTLPGSKSIYLSKGHKEDGKYCLKPIGGSLPPGTISPYDYLKKALSQMVKKKFSVRVAKHVEKPVPSWQGIVTVYQLEVIEPEGAEAKALLEASFMDILLLDESKLCKSAKTILAVLGL
jgi:hypothetical protein